MSERKQTAGVLVIGDEILSGEVKERNVGVIADLLLESGVELREVRIVPDETPEIVAAVNALRRHFTYVITTGGIGPTHDDVTADSVAAAFGVGIDVDERARAILERHHGVGGLNAARLRMARIPFGADLIESPRTKAPGFRLDNVFVLAGVPEIMVAMLEQVKPLLGAGAPVARRVVEAAALPESVYADALRSLAAERADVSIGSYPTMTEDGWKNTIVVRGRSADAVESATTAVETMLDRLGRRTGSAVVA
ncbi:MAG: competence/damage-inducible protein A [Leifsonia xyli]|nr:MAG: competence/damage-inducible protein A [Leifsonia xyli]